MITPSLMAPFFVLFVVPFFLLGLLRVSKWTRHRKGVRPPFSDRLLRSPGQTLRRQIEDISDDVATYMIGASTLPLLFYCLYLSQSGFAGASGGLKTLLWVVAGAFVIFALYKVTILIRKRRERRIGLAGEMAAGEELNRLMLDGYHVYHDFPSNRFNIDHILVGEAGVFAVETKARSKGRRGNGRGDAKVVYDGESLRFPGWMTSEPMNQAKAQAVWLSRWLSGAVGESVKVMPIVTLPGWYIERKRRNGVPVLNPKQVKTYLDRKREVTLSKSMVKRICHQLEQKCRDVDLWDWY